MFFLHLSNKTENLIRQLFEVLRLDEERDPFCPEYFLIQSQGMERMISQQLAQKFISWCNYEYMLPTRFFAQMAKRLGMDEESEDYSREKVCWNLENILRSVSGDQFAQISRYLASDTTGIKRYQLARQLAYVFDQYQIMRLAMIDSWGQERLTTTNSAEIYQMELWKMLEGTVGHSHHRGDFLRDLITLLNTTSDVSAALPKRVSLFGLHSLPPLFLSCLNAFSSHCDVHLYLLSPCATYWVEQVTQRASLRNNIASLRQGSPVADIPNSGHPLLASLGQQGKEFQKMLLQDIQFSGEYKSFSDPVENSASCLLHRVQSDMLLGEVRVAKEASSSDGSIVVVSAHTPYREMMILKDRILHWLDEDPGLALKDIVVMAPDITEYSGFISAVYHDIPHSIADKNEACSNTFIATFLQFLSLCTSRFGWSEVLDLLERKEVYLNFEIQENDLEIIRHWVLSSGIRWGLHAKHKQEHGVPGKEECTWQTGLDRLFMGYAFSRDCEVEGAFPYLDIEGSMAVPLGGLSLFCELLTHAHTVVMEHQTLKQWAEAFAGFAERLFVDTDEAHLLTLYGIFTELEQEYGGIHHEPVHFDVIRSWIETVATDKKSSSGFLRGQLTFCSMLPMRSIPFQRVCLLGLNDTAFPKNDRHPPFDLLGCKCIPGDRSRRSDDRYQFLEAILSARKGLYISYIGQSIRSNDMLPPSVVVSELFELLQLYGIDQLTEYHPLHGFSQKYFDDQAEPGYFSYNKELLQVSCALQENADPLEPWWHGAIESKQREIIPLTDLFGFFQNPQKYFVQHVLGIRPGISLSVVEEHEPFVMDMLQKYFLEQDLLYRRMCGKEWEEIRQQAQVAGQWILGTPGELGFEKLREEEEPFLERVMEQKKVEQLNDIEVDLMLDGMLISGQLTSLYTNGSFISRYAKLKAKDIFNAWVQHCLAAVCCNSPKKTLLLTKDYEIVFPAETANTDDVRELLTLFLSGQQEPSVLLPEPTFAYAEQYDKTKHSGKGDPLQKAVASFKNTMDRGFEAEWDLLYQGQRIENLFGAEFIEMAKWFYESIWKKADVRKL